MARPVAPPARRSVGLLGWGGMFRFRRLLITATLHASTLLAQELFNL